jgi:hypothetical protein
MVFDELLMQFQADVLGVPVIRPKVAETTALGAAYAAGLAVGFWKAVDDLRANWQKDHEWKPKMDAKPLARRTSSSGRRRSPAPSTGSSSSRKAILRGPSGSTGGPRRLSLTEPHVEMAVFEQKRIMAPDPFRPEVPSLSRASR